MQYEAINKSISHVVVHKFKGHLWYLGPELVPLALFSDQLPLEEKRLLIKSLKALPENWTNRKIKLLEHSGLETKCLQELVNSSSDPARRSLRIDINLLFENDPEVWKNLEVFSNAAKIINSLKVVNDAAERSVTLMSSFNESITKTESEMQNLIQVVEDHRKKIPTLQKGILQEYHA